MALDSSSSSVVEKKGKPLVSASDVAALKAIDCTLVDMPEIMRLSLAEFSDRCKTEKDRDELKAEIYSLFLPKMVLNPFMGHKIIGLKKPGAFSPPSADRPRREPAGGGNDRLQHRLTEARWS